MSDPIPTRPISKIIIVGAGPSGLLLALLLAKHGIPVHPRAAHYGAPAIPEFVRAGMADRIRERGMVLDTMCWRSSDEGNEYMAGFDAGRVLRRVHVDGVGEVDLRTHCLALQDLDRLMLDEVVERYGGVVEWEHRVVEVGQDGKGAWCEVEVGNGKERKVVRGDYVVGRLCLGMMFPGFTWDEQIIATNTYYDFDGKFGWQDANFIIHPEHFFVAARLTRDGLYRITYGETPGLICEEYLARQPGSLRPSCPATRSQTTTKSPISRPTACTSGGLGITGGFVDVGGLYDCLAGIWDGKVDEYILDLYSEERTEKRVSDKDPKTRFERDQFMQDLMRAETDDVYLKELLMMPMEVRYDFTQHYKEAVREVD
ncbi:FAD/NAD(P)-binding domain-containing protein [Parathielavia appendiculata]|uniref:FAD/NAD(P)-binding domain-containing protein n=1 Tax=Parathielavia appendiculata TaxID=2587402 RepID=A0AAN6YYE6_9PEZI|nr:FAD/NAD(P)-binding domain-containing protein [Parathielavia appendiculata]